MTNASKNPQSIKDRLRFLDNTAVRGRLIVLIVGCLVTLTWAFGLPPVSGLLTAFDLNIQDAFMHVQKSMQAASGISPFGKDIVLLTIDDESMRVLGSEPPLPRQVYARLCDSLVEAKASVIAFQIVFDGQSPVFASGRSCSESLNRYFKQTFGESLKKSAAEDDQTLAEALQKCHNVVLAAQVNAMGPGALGSRIALITPHEEFVRALGGGDCLGNVSLTFDDDGLVRSASICGDKFPGHRSVTTSFPIRVLEKLFNSPAIQTARGVTIAGRTIPGIFKIDYAGPAGTFESIPLWKALEWSHFHNKSTPSQSEAALQNPFAGKIVLINYQNLTFPGQSEATSGQSPEHRDGVATPFGGWRRPMSQGEVQANIIANLLSGKFITPVSKGQESLILLCLTGLFAFACGFARGRTIPLTIVTLSISALWFAFCAVSYFQLSLLLPCLVPIIGIFGIGALFVWLDENVLRSQQRRRKTRLFRKLASRQVADEIAKHQLKELSLEGKEASITVLVCEIANLTKLIEGQEPESAIRIANDCIKMISDAVTSNGGVIERCLNHGVVAIWGAPLSQSEREQAASAASAAMTIPKDLAKLSLGSSNEESPQCLIGICSGTAVCGMVGTAENALYTAMGRPVDEAFQLTQENRMFGTRQLMSKSVLRALGDTNLETREVFQLSAADGPEAKRIFELLGERGRLPGALEEAASLYRRAMRALEERDQEEAEHLLESALRLLPDDGPSQAALSMCRRTAKEINVPR